MRYSCSRRSNRGIGTSVVALVSPCVLLSVPVALSVLQAGGGSSLGAEDAADEYSRAIPGKQLDNRIPGSQDLAGSLSPSAG